MGRISTLISNRNTGHLAEEAGNVVLALAKCMKTESKREIRKSNIKRNILGSAGEIFLEKRYSSVTTDEIASRAGVTKRTLYKYFPSKLALYISMFDHYLQQLSKQMAAAARAEPNPERKLTRIWETLHDFTCRNEKFMRLYWMLDSDEFEGEMTEELVRFVREHTRSMFATAVRANELARKDGLIQDVDPLLLAHLMSAINKGIFIHVSKERKLEMDTPDADELNGLVLRILQTGLFKR